MTFEFYSKIPRKTRLLIIFILIILAAYFIVHFFISGVKTVPEEFLRARQEASLVAQDIVNISNNSGNTFGEIARLDKEGKYKEALVLVSRELENNRQARAKAISLSMQLETMAKNLDKISPSSAGQKALEAISSETALISRLIDYNDYLTQLLGALQDKFMGKSDGDKISELIGKINDETGAINDLNVKFNETMNEFDLK